MKCPKCSKEMILLLTSHICEVCEKPSIQTPPVTREKVGMAAPAFTAKYASTKINGVGFYYDPGYAKKHNCGKVDFQIENGGHSRYVFLKQDIRDLLSYIIGRGKFSIRRAGITFEYDDILCKLFIATYSFNTSDIEKICQFFKPMVAPWGEKGSKHFSIYGLICNYFTQTIIVLVVNEGK